MVGFTKKRIIEYVSEDIRFFTSTNDKRWFNDTNCELIFRIPDFSVLVDYRLFLIYRCRVLLFFDVNAAFYIFAWKIFWWDNRKVLYKQGK